MNLKNFIGDLFGFNQELSHFKRVNNSLVTQLANCKTNLNTMENNYKELSKKNNKLIKKLEGYEESEEAKFWNEKYPVKNVEYWGRTWGTSKKKIPIDVRLLITPQDYHIHELLEKHDLYYGGGSVDDHIVKIYKFVKNNYYRYVYDHNNYDVTEYWEFPFEMFEALERGYTKGFDCDSWASFIVSFVIASGVPEWKCRVVVGDSKIGGHSTCYFHCDKDNKWHHLNSTMGSKSGYDKLEDFPLTDDAGTTKDVLGIYNVWNSYNNKYAWTTFETGVVKDGRKKRFIVK